MRKKSRVWKSHASVPLISKLIWPLYQLIHLFSGPLCSVYLYVQWTPVFNWSLWLTFELSWSLFSFKPSDQLISMFRWTLFFNGSLCSVHQCVYLISMFIWPLLTCFQLIFFLSWPLHSVYLFVLLIFAQLVSLICWPLSLDDIFVYLTLMLTSMFSGPLCSVYLFVQLAPFSVDFFF